MLFRGSFLTSSSKTCLLWKHNCLIGYNQSNTNHSSDLSFINSYWFYITVTCLKHKTQTPPNTSSFFCSVRTQRDQCKFYQNRESYKTRECFWSFKLISHNNEVIISTVCFLCFKLISHNYDVIINSLFVLNAWGN